MKLDLNFCLFKHVLDVPSGKCLPHLDRPVHSWIEIVITVVRDKIEKFIKYVQEEIDNQKDKPGNLDTVREMTNTLDKFHSTCAVLQVKHLARTILDTTHAFRANKIWNSHGSTTAANSKANKGTHA